MLDSLPVICSISQQVGIACEHLSKLALGAAQINTDNISELYQDMVLDEIEHIQILVVELSKLVAPYEEELTEAQEEQCEFQDKGD